MFKKWKLMFSKCSEEKMFLTKRKSWWNSFLYVWEEMFCKVSPLDHLEVQCKYRIFAKQLNISIRTNYCADYQITKFQMKHAFIVCILGESLALKGSYYVSGGLGDQQWIIPYMTAWVEPNLIFHLNRSELRLWSQSSVVQCVQK